MKEFLAARVEKIMNTSSNADKFFSFETFLLFCSKIYSTAIKARTSLYKNNLIRSKKLPCFVISIGNITMGGTGKTPMTIYMAGMIKELGYKAVIVTRGYRGTYKDAQAIVSNGSESFLNVYEAGDEAGMIAESLSIPVIVGKNRYKAGMLAIEKFYPDVLIFDDAFQHIALERSINLLLCDFNRPFGNHELIPRGRLREPKTATKRSDAVVFTRSDRKKVCTEIENNKGNSDYFMDKPVFHTHHSACISKFINFDEKSKLKFESFKNIKELNITGFLFSAIADNESFRSTCKSMGIKIKGFSEFLDHHWYKKEDFDNIYKNFENSKAEYLVTTEKDYIKIKNIISDTIPLIVIGIQIEFNSQDKDLFKDFIKVNLKKFFQQKA